MDEPATGIKVRKMSSTPNRFSPQVELPMPGPSSVQTEGEKLIKLMEMFPSHSTEELQDALNIHVTVEMAALALSSNVANDTSDFDGVLLQPTFLPRDHDVVTLHEIIEQIQEFQQ